MAAREDEIIAEDTSWALFMESVLASPARSGGHNDRLPAWSAELADHLWAYVNFMPMRLSRCMSSRLWRAASSACLP